MESGSSKHRAVETPPGICFDCRRSNAWRKVKPGVNLLQTSPMSGFQVLDSKAICVSFEERSRLPKQRSVRRVEADRRQDIGVLISLLGLRAENVSTTRRFSPMRAVH
jgi:hypothetical protein